MQQRPGGCVRGVVGRVRVMRERDKANHETGTNEATIRNSKLLGSLEDARFVRPSISRTAAALASYSCNGHVAIQLLGCGIGEFWWDLYILSWAAGVFNYAICVGTAACDVVGAAVKIFLGGDVCGEEVGGLVPAFAAVGIVGTGGAVHLESWDRV